MNNIDESISQVYFNLKEPDEESDSIIAENINSVLRVSLLEFLHRVSRPIHQQ
jgi:hypothetical protein